MKRACMWGPHNFICCIALRFHTFHCYLIRLILEEIYKAGEVDPRKLPRNFNSLSAKEQVSTLSTTAKQSFWFVCLFFFLSRSRLEQPGSGRADQPAFSYKQNDKIKIKQGVSRATGQPGYTGLAHLIWTGPKCGIIKYITALPVSG